jgi:hypothetical protein
MYILVPECDLFELDGDFMEEEVKCAIFGFACDKAPGSGPSTRHVGA